MSGALTGRVGIKLHTGEKKGPNIIPHDWVHHLMARDMPNSYIVGTNTYYKGDRYATARHRETLTVNGWTLAHVDIIDEHGTAMLPVKGGKWFRQMSVGKCLLAYDSLLALTYTDDGKYFG